MIELLIILNIIDILATYFMVFMNGAEELNPYVNYLIQNWGVSGLVLCKAIPLSILWFCKDYSVYLLTNLLFNLTLYVYTILTVIHVINILEVTL